MPWLLAQTLATHEFQALERLTVDPSIPVYVPTYRRSIASRHTASPRIVTYPLFARYLFVCLDQLSLNLERLRLARQVWPVRSDTGSLLFVPDREIANLQARQAAGEFDQLAKPDQPAFAVGQAVSVKIGDTSRPATITHLLRHRRVRLALDGAFPTVTVAVDFIELSP
jgi:hypothetical protein